MTARCHAPRICGSVLAVLAAAAAGCAALPPPDDRFDGDYERHTLHLVPCPPATLTVGRPGRIAVRASDSEGHALSFELQQLAPETAARVALDAAAETATLRWTPTADDVGRHQPKLIARDGHGELAVLSLIVDVVAAPAAVTTRLTPTRVEVLR